MTYHIDPVTEAQATDKKIEAHGLKVYLDAKSLLYIAGTTLDYEQTLMAARFKFNNPNATTSCSCGESFGV